MRDQLQFHNKASTGCLMRQETAIERVENPMMLQRTIGNRAVAHLIHSVGANTLSSAPASVIQRAKLKNKDVNDLVSWAMNSNEPNQKNAILQRVYKSLWLDAQGESSKVTPSADDLKKAGVIDDEDITALEERVKLKTSNPTDQKKLLEDAEKKKLEEKKPIIEAKYGHHIFLGDFNDKGAPTGYHSTQGGSKTHEAYGTITNIDDIGVYQQSVRERGKPANRKVHQSTFFPDTASKDDVITAITSVYELKHQTVKYPQALNGMELVKTGNTIYPAGGQNDLLAE
ncbi:EndoU domain-containing protein [Paenibacillus sp. SI8]|uniref:EndoU domain-containing protein n=1 Tax=unclassified Paenibacillus TaxID=185978 RepID=UPI0034671C28